VRDFCSRVASFKDGVPSFDAHSLSSLQQRLLSAFALKTPLNMYTKSRRLDCTLPPAGVIVSFR
jgi:hypothetical protein